ncbi:hypothetical protein DPMN_144874 [Dreissena polymorpha]|uniref:Uncharacterized protein n=1 Tax=Dreissena polymorpha TaxID=45954 RepID=A0A9D4J0G2_DREPO|nr:hypothetical protein DPMN_144874 [Dreissena polymorpha]
MGSRTTRNKHVRHGDHQPNSPCFREQEVEGSPQLEVRVPKTDFNSQAQYNAIPTYCKYLYAHIMRAQHLGACFLPRCRRSVNDDYRHLLYARSACPVVT